jgi:hypothetical protein
MSEQNRAQKDSTSRNGAAGDPNSDNREQGLEAEQESAAAMDADVPQPSHADVPQPPDADKTTEGQPS